MFSLDELWVKLSTPYIGFYTSRLADKIPASPGIYAWFLPLRLKGSPEEFLTITRKILSYDPQSNGPGQWESDEAGFRWDPLYVKIARQTAIPRSDRQEENWRILNNASPDIQRSFRLALLASSIFTKPLYVGLSNNLIRRYTEHTSAQSTFHERFERYMASLNSHLTVNQLLFVCVPLRPLEIGSEGNEYTDAQIRTIEHILKILTQPAFGEI